MAADQFGIVAADERRAGAGEGVEVVGGGVLVCAGVEKREYVAGRDLGEVRLGHDHVEGAASPGHVGAQHRLGAGAIGNQALPAVVLEVHVGQVGVGRVGFDPGERQRLALALHVADRREVDPGIGVEAAAGLDLESDRRGVEVDHPQSLGEWPADRLGVGARPGRAFGCVGALRKQPAERVARRRIAAAGVELPRRPALPAPAQLVEQRAERRDCGTPDPGLGRVAAEVEVKSGEVDVRAECVLGRDREDVFGRDARLVALDSLANRFAGGRHLRGFVESG